MASAKSWLSEYTGALDARDRREHAQIKFINAYTKLADRTASSIDNTSSQLDPERQQAPASPQPTGQARSSPGFPFRTRSPAVKEDPTANLSSSDALTRLRTDLAATQKSRAELESQIKPLTLELKQLNQQVGRDSRRIMELEREKATLERRVRDRDDEIKGKAKLVEETQDEMVSLNLQLNIAEQKSEKLQEENKELVDRWMARMGKEADEMNQRSRWS